MSKLKVCILIKKLKYSKYKHIWENFLNYASNELDFCTLDDIKTFKISTNNIHLFLTINDEGLSSWGEFEKSNKRLIVWFINNPFNYVNAINKYITSNKLLFLCAAKEWVRLIKPSVGQYEVLFYPFAFNPVEIPNNTNKCYDISFFGIIDDIETLKEEIFKEINVIDRPLFEQIIKFGFRNPGLSLYSIISYFNLTYTNMFLAKIDQELFNKIENYLINYKRLKLLEALKDYNIKHYQPKDYSEYYNDNTLIDIASKSKIILNLDEYSNSVGISPFTFGMLATRSIVLTDNNPLLRYYYPDDLADIYYNLNNIVELKNKIDNILNNNNINLYKITGFQSLVKQEHSWETRISEIIPYIKRISYE